VPTVYALKDPRDGALFYVGATTYPPRWLQSDRVSNHISASRRGHERNPKSQRIREIVAAGLRPIGVVLEVTATRECASAREGVWIRALRKKGEPLLNVRDGGLGRPIAFDPDRFAKRSADAAARRAARKVA
jgi:hypothetical protein